MMSSPFTVRHRDMQHQAVRAGRERLDPSPRRELDRRCRERLDWLCRSRFDFAGGMRHSADDDDDQRGEADNNQHTHDYGEGFYRAHPAIRMQP